MALNDWLTRQQGVQGGSLRDQWLQQHSPWASTPGTLERFGVSTPEADQYRQFLSQVQGLAPSGTIRGGGTTENDEFYQPSAQEQGVSDQASQYYSQLLAKYPDLYSDDSWINQWGPYIFAGGMGGMLASGLGAFGGAAEAGAAGAGASGGSIGTGALGSGFSGAGLGSGTLGAEAIGGLGAMGGGTSALGAGAAGAAAGFAGSVGSPLATGVGALPEWATASGIGGAGTGMVSGVTGGAAGAAAPAGSALSRIIDGTATNNDWLQVLGSAGATGLGMYSANQQGNALQDLYNQSRADRAPFLSQAQNWMNNPEAYWQGPGQASLNANLAQLGAKFGNPVSSPTALGIASGAGLRDWRDAVTGMANLGLSGEDTRARLGMGSAQADADMWSTLGGGVSDILNPRTSLADMMKQYGLVIGGSRT